jgi:hypothetical protein
MKRQVISREDRLAYLGLFREALGLAIDSLFHYLLLMRTYLRSCKPSPSMRFSACIPLTLPSSSVSGFAKTWSTLSSANSTSAGRQALCPSSIVVKGR